MDVKAENMKTKAEIDKDITNARKGNARPVTRRYG